MATKSRETTVASAPDSSEESSVITARQLATRVGRSRDWMLRMARQGLIPHVRVGPPPLPGRKDTRPVCFTAAQAAEVEALAHHIEYRPAGGAA